jgi:hypothetical protein
MELAVGSLSSCPLRGTHDVLVREIIRGGNLSFILLGFGFNCFLGSAEKRSE